MNNIQVTRQVIERCNEYEIPLCCAFIDFEKIFDCIKLSTIFEALQRHSIEEPYVSLPKPIYINATATLHIKMTHLQSIYGKVYDKIIPSRLSYFQLVWKKYSHISIGQKKEEKLIANISVIYASPTTLCYILS